MLKARYVDRYVQLYEPFRNIKYNLSKTSWEIIKLIKKYGKDKAVPKIMKLFNIGEKNAKEDIETILYNLELLKIKIEDIPTKISKEKYAPRTVHFDITTKCNLKCIYCLASDRMKKNKELSTKQVVNIINQLPELGTWLLCLSGGEPFLRKDIFKILDHVEKLQLLTQVYTNGTLITKEVAKKLSEYKYVFLQVSLDSVVPEHNDFNRGKGTYAKTIQGIKYLLQYGEIPEICMVLTTANYKDLEETAEFLHKLGIKYIRIGPAHPYCGRGYENREKIQLTISQWREIGKKIIELNNRYEGSLTFFPTREFVVYSIDNYAGKIPKCGNSRQVLYIGSDGVVYPCIFLVEPEFALGDGKKEELSHIWKHSKLIKKIRYLTVDDIEECKTCEVKHLCSGGCRASARYHFGSIYAHDPYCCALLKRKVSKR